MVKIKQICLNFLNSFLGIRLICFVIVQFTVIHHNLDSLLNFCKLVKCQVTPYAIPFIVQNYYFVFIYGISCVYFFSNVPYLQSKQLYSIMRMGRKKWLWNKLLNVWITAFFLVVVELVLIYLVMFSVVEYSLDWGKVWYSLALTDASAQYDVSINVPYQIINSYTPVQAVVYTALLMLLVTGLIGIIMYVWSLYFNRGSAVLLTSGICVLTLVFANLHKQVEILSFVTPLEWVNLMLLDGEICMVHPQYVDVVGFILFFFIFATILCTYKINCMDMHLSKEE